MILPHYTVTLTCNWAVTVISTLFSKRQLITSHMRFQFFKEVT